MKEVAEETGIECVPERVLAVIDGQRMGFSRFGDVHAALPLHGRRRRAEPATRWSAQTSAGSDRRAARGDGRRCSGGGRWRSPRSAASEFATSFDRRCARRSGASNYVESRSRRKRSTSADQRIGVDSTSSSATGVAMSPSTVALVVVVEHRLERADVVHEVLVVGDQGGDPRVVLGGCADERVDRWRACRSWRRPARAAPSPPSATAPGRRSRARPPTVRRSARPAVDSASCSTPTMPGRSFVAGALQVEAVDQVGIAGRADDLHRPGVGDVGEQGAEADRHARRGSARRCRRVARRRAATAARAPDRARARRRRRGARPTTCPPSARRSSAGRSSSRT